MFTEFEDKGKIFTNVIPKHPVAVILQTDFHRIQGFLHVRPTERLKDELNRSEKFIAITDAIIRDNNGNEIYRSNFLTINCERIHWLIPQDELIAGMMGEEGDD